MPTFPDLVNNCAQKTGSNKHEVELIINTFIEEIILSLCSRQKAKISKFGTFEIRKREKSQNGGYIKFRQSRLISKLLSLTEGDNCG